MNFVAIRADRLKCYVLKRLERCYYAIPLCRPICNDIEFVILVIMTEIVFQIFYCHNSCVLIRRVGRTRTVPCSCAVSDFDRLHRATRGTTPPFKLPDAYPGSIRKSSPHCFDAQQSVLPWNGNKRYPTSLSRVWTALRFSVPTRASSHQKKAARQEFRSVAVSAIEDQYCQGQCCQPPSDYVMPAHNAFWFDNSLNSAKRCSRFLS